MSSPSTGGAAAYGLARLLAIALAALPLFALQARSEFVPIDEAASRPDFFSFRAQLQTALARRDVQAVLNAVDPKIKNGFGGDDGIDAFKKLWRLEEPDSPLWAELSAVLALGGSFSGDTFTAPYVFSRWPEAVDSFENIAVIGSEVRIHTEPAIESPVVASVSFCILQLDLDNNKAGSDDTWTAVRIDGHQGYIASRFVRSPINYRAMFSTEGGRWQLNFFGNGD